MPKCVVTGATGHIGNVLIKELIQKNYEVTAFVLEGEDITFLKEFPIQFAYGDVRKIETLKQAFRGKDMVFHLAGIIEIGSTNKKLMKEVNVQGTKNVWQACKEEKIKRLIAEKLFSPTHSEIFLELLNVLDEKTKGICSKL